MADVTLGGIVDSIGSEVQESKAALGTALENFDASDPTSMFQLQLAMTTYTTGLEGLSTSTKHIGDTEKSLVQK
ncbi:MAG: hypothetical protein OXJ53_13665 [Gammaproteobacteria bacterium]|nr:hypothetical protein [Gammaproteobacteria bacterium]MDE0273933.1 hypothetical protein [Gammaproteobacteria bacterium]